MLLNEAINFYMLLFRNNALKEKTVHLSVVYYVHVFLLSTANGYVLILLSTDN
jgi:hypothetical protein